MGGRARGPVVAQAVQQAVPQSAFWDTSALVPLCVQESRSSHALSLHKQYEIVVWWATPVEVASALTRLLRMKLLSAHDWAQARKTASIFAQAWTVVAPSNGLRAKALAMVERYDLRAADAFQLAAALEWCVDVPQGREFLTADTRLFQAALLSGFDAVNI
jgi:predicted nucleic acid-binding protein